MVCQHIWACSKEVVSKSPDNTVEINYSSPSSSAGCSGDSTSNSESISEKFGVSDECYHELTMIHPQLPRSYKVTATRRDISSSVELLPLPSPYAGAYSSLKTCIALILAQKVINILEYNNSTQLSFSK